MSGGIGRSFQISQLRKQTMFSKGSSSQVSRTFEPGSDEITSGPSNLSSGKTGAPALCKQVLALV